MDKKEIESYKDDVIKQINKYRNNHGAKPLMNYSDIDEIAQKFADKLSRAGSLDYSYNQYQGQDLGESVYESEVFIAPMKLIKILYDENLEYDYNDRDPEPSNFTQMVWKNSELIGFGMQKNSEHKYYFVINYFPSGNVEGQFKKNVFPYGTKPVEEAKPLIETNNSNYGTKNLEETKPIFKTNNNKYVKRSPKETKPILKINNNNYETNYFEETKPIITTNNNNYEINSLEENKPIFTTNNNKKESSIRTIYKKRDLSNGQNQIEITVNKHNEKKVTFYEEGDKDPFRIKKNYDRQDSFISNYKTPNESFINKIYSRKSSFINKDKDEDESEINDNSSTKDAKYNYKKKVSFSTKNLNHNNYSSNKTSSIREYIRKSLKKEKDKEKEKENFAKSKDNIRKSTKKDNLRKSVNKDKVRKSMNKSFLRKSSAKKEFSMKQSINKSFLKKPSGYKNYQKRDTKNYNLNTSMTNRKYKKKISFYDKNNQKSSAVNINHPLRDSSIDNQNNNTNYKPSQTGHNFYKKKSTKHLDKDNAFSEKKNLITQLIERRKKELEAKSKNRKSMKKDPNSNNNHAYPKHGSSSVDYNSFCYEALQTHNHYRKIHHVEPLKLNKDLCKIAENYSKHLANIGYLQHSDNCYHDDALGENLYFCFGMDPTGSLVTKNWYSEIKNYNYNGDWSNGTGHFTQIVWKDTKEVGFGKSKNAKGKTFVVANYYPAGNFLGFFKYNVLRP